MIDAIKKFLAGGAASSAGDPRATPDAAADLRVAACALLLELAHADDEFSPDEQRQIEQALGHHFDLSPEEGKELVALAEERRKTAIDLHQFTRQIAAQYDEGQRTVLAEIMWRVVYADGNLSHHEEGLLRKIGSLLDLKPGYLATARKRAVPQDPPGPPPPGPAESSDPDAGA
jgi:uncharacterized tellurite resistance protein B-like protein